MLLRYESCIIDQGCDKDWQEFACCNCPCMVFRLHQPDLQLESRSLVDETNSDRQENKQTMYKCESAVVFYISTLNLDKILKQPNVD